MPLPSLSALPRHATIVKDKVDYTFSAMRGCLILIAVYADAAADDIYYFHFSAAMALLPLRRCPFDADAAMLLMRDSCRYAMLRRYARYARR